MTKNDVPLMDQVYLIIFNRPIFYGILMFSGNNYSIFFKFGIYFIR